MNIHELLDQLDAFCNESTLPLDSLKQLLDQLDMPLESIDQSLVFNNEKYQRNLLRRRDNYEALLLCFEAGQRTPIHDHAGCECGVRVIAGEGIETIFERSPDGWLYATGSSTLPSGGVTGSADMDIHQLSNLQSQGGRLITLHVYSPPLGEVGNYCIEDNSITRVTAESRECVTIT